MPHKIACLYEVILQFKGIPLYFRNDGNRQHEASVLSVTGQINNLEREVESIHTRKKVGDRNGQSIKLLN